MTKAILSVGALLAAAIALAGCAGSGSGSGSESDTTGSVAGAHHAQGSGNFRASVHGFEANLQTSVRVFQSGNLTKAIASGGPLLTNCAQTVDTKIAPHVSTHAQKLVLAHLRTACADISQAAGAGASGNALKAKQFARAALMQAQVAARLSG
ncbi:MAG TPA: hypothetical protein VGH18_00715 [Gaiellaceae bacterium]|jgi:hypothetical protein